MYDFLCVEMNKKAERICAKAIYFKKTKKDFIFLRKCVIINMCLCDKTIFVEYSIVTFEFRKGLRFSDYG